MDLIFIDGGHSHETVLSDWSSVQPLVTSATSVLFDDYPSFGVGRVVDEIDRRRWEVTVFPTIDRFATSDSCAPLQLQLARARRRATN